MFDEIQFEKIKRLPKYVFAAINEIKLEMRHNNEDVIDFSMGNPDGSPPEHVIDKLCESARKGKNQGYSASRGIYKLRLAICNWYKKTYDVDLDPESQVCVTMGSKEGYVHLVQAITNLGDNAIVPEPAYPIHYYAFILNGANVSTFGLKWNDEMELDVEDFFANLKRVLKEVMPKPKFVVVNFPHNPTTIVAYKEFYERLVAMAKEERFYIISDIAYAELCFDGFKTPSIFEVPGATDVAVESYTLSKTYNMAGWRVGFLVGNAKMIGALQKIKSWIDYGIYTPMQIASTVALDGDQSCIEEIKGKYEKRMEVLIKAFGEAGWEMKKPKASMFIWAKIPQCAESLGSLEFSKRLLKEAKIAVSPGVGFGSYGEGYVRIALIENEKRIRQAARNLKVFLKSFQ
ncbi:LL-diaminopimelate aminotransferase [Helicobacter sp. MIT 05-5293]|uniref:Aminotransferase n=1 Tax=uncultured Helicobacter sp. TaxID=175537 RepID=A0A650EKT5_9HELI|nr:LL-diaminopimelate aminotransferase [Helicobacter sp. MIT 05-5293]QGT50339.1 aminotransferase [uncultured Helicobacter sp.]TLD82232.1 LL-diaminopimelate aminotransferase [Helicobacter sp. MIT 05-5293]